MENLAYMINHTDISDGFKDRSFGSYKEEILTNPKFFDIRMKMLREIIGNPYMMSSSETTTKSPIAMTAE